MDAPHSDPPDTDCPDLTDGTLLGGRVRYRQPRTGFRTGIEPVLLAASIAARPGERVLEAGTGSGAALLCLLARLPEVTALGIEQNARLAAVARANLEANGMAGGDVLTADLLTALPPGRFDHAMANPPWHSERSTASPDPARDGAKRARPGLLTAWAAALARTLRPGGSLTLVLPAASLADAMEAFRVAGCGGADLLPLWPKARRNARLILLRSIKGSAGACRVLPGLVLHDEPDYTAAASRVLRDGDAIDWT